uniref:Leucine zipper transcription factor-like protein 1 n=1 Tax=Rhabditophanes sp. KR3021 TaxID=114890 RepID=A0AC35UI12_9BILA
MNNESNQQPAEFSPRVLEILQSQDELIEELSNELKICQDQIFKKSSGVKRKGEDLRTSIKSNDVMSGIQRKMEFVMDMVDELQLKSTVLEGDVKECLGMKNETDKIKKLEKTLLEMNEMRNEVKELHLQIIAKESHNKDVLDSLKKMEDSNREQRRYFEDLVDDQKRDLKNKEEKINTLEKELQYLKEQREKELLQSHSIERSVHELIEERVNLTKRLDTVENENKLLKQSHAVFEGKQSIDRPNETSDLISNLMKVIESVKVENEILNKKMENMNNAYQFRVTKLREERTNLKNLLKRYFDEAA